MFTTDRGGNGYGAYMRRTLPSILSMVFLSFYTTIDGLFVSRSAGSDALAAINIVIPVTCLLFSLAVMLASGAGAIIGKRLGEGRRKDASALFSFVSLCLLAVTAAFTVLGFVFIRPLAVALGSSDILYPHVRDYLSMIVLGAIPMAFKLFFEYMARTDGHPKVALAMSFSGLALNVVFDFVLVVLLDLGTLGAGLGTTLSISVSALIGFIHFLRGRNLSFIRPRFEWGQLLHSCTNGASEMLSELSTGTVTLLLNLIIMSLYGEDGIAAVTVVMYVYYFFIAFFMGLSVAAAPEVSFSYGEGNWKRIGTILKHSMLTLSILALAMTVSSLVFAGPIASLFLEGGAAHELTVLSLCLMAPIWLTAGYNVFFSAWFTAIGDGLSSAIISTLRSLVFVILFIFLLPRAIGDVGIWLALPAADAATLPIALILYKWKGTVGKIKRHRLAELSAVAQDFLS